MQKVEDGSVALILSPKILREFIKVLNTDEMLQKIKDKDLKFRMTMGKLMSICTVVEPSQKLDIVKDDPDDNIILECAKEGKVDFIVTNDKHLLKLKSFEGIIIVTPKEFLS